ncbi:MAG: CPBP family glutamic-type intramembrane protease [Candidatus Binatia bacterium]
MAGDGTTPTGATSRVVECLLATSLALWLAIRFGLASAWLVVPIVFTLARRRSLDDLAIEPRLTPPSITAHLALGVTLLALYCAGRWAWATAFAGAEVTPRLPPDFGLLALHQLLVVAIPEEIFFRGYLQSNLDRAIPAPRWRVFGAPVGPGFFLQAAIFAACHLVTGDWLRVRVGAFGLLAGWLRARSGSLLSPILYHAVANLWVAILEHSLR